MSGKSQRLYREDYTDFQWFELMKKHGEDLPEEYCDIFDRQGEICEDYEDLFNVDVFVTS